MDLKRKQFIRDKAVGARELLKGFTPEQRDNFTQSTQTVEEFSDYILELTNEIHLEEEPDPTPPKYVIMGASDCALCLVKYGEKSFEYYRHGGQWSIEFKYSRGVLISKSSHSSMNNIILHECTEEAWRVSNGQYAPTKVADPYAEETVEDDDNEIPF